VAEARRAQIMASARALLEQTGPETVTMRAIADRLGIRAPSLYKHFRDKADLEVALIAQGFEEQAAAFESALADGRPPVTALARAYRDWARDHPHLYRLMTDRPLPRERLPVGVEARAAAPIVRALGGNVDLARSAWAFAHGMASLELAGRFPPGADLDAAWAIGASAFDRLASATKGDTR
jgi:AcrR family transcriptional regulator